jgi:hypothetical protein
LFEEVAYLAYYLHWPPEQIMHMEHRERQQWVREVARLNERLNEQLTR